MAAPIPYCMCLDREKSFILKTSLFSYLQVYAWGDNDHGQQGNGTTIVNRRPALVCGLDGIKVARVACGSSHSVAWTAPDPPLPAATEPVMFTTTKDPLGSYSLGMKYCCIIFG